ncbi:membrane protein insertion efficiency factor YidD [Dietzia alimentaria]|uniref:membrane protein insertion efficiency factor YidD n=1 Tax=Dietzia alimentaria TaxID=665550 RepID=UPI00029A57DF|nr:membrane protein insertion efficiency factor YidD [Dietzia alimentaria]
MTEANPGPVARILLWMLDFYQKGISPLTPPSCRFEPSCSGYAVEAVRVHGAWNGTWLSVWRVLRCGPWTPGGWDPVPERRVPHHEVTEPRAPDPPGDQAEQPDISRT